jgi:hypothetical protein
MARAIGKEMVKICLLSIFTCKEGVVFSALMGANLQLVSAMNCLFFYIIA